MTEPSGDKPEEHPVPGFVLADGRRRFAVTSGGRIGLADRWPAPGGGEFVPTADLLVGQVVHFAQEPIRYESQVTLFGEIQAFIHRYCELPDNYEDIGSLYVLLSWLFDFVPVLPYLRAFGDWGSGKSRFLQVAGSICFRPIFASGATTPAPIFRILDKFQGTLILDEADFKDSAAHAEIVKILNNGYKPGFPVLRAVPGPGASRFSARS